VKTPVEGRVLELLAAPGDLILTGEPLLVIHSHEIHGAQGDLLNMRERLRLARSRREAGEELYELEGISRVELEQRGQEALAAGIQYDVARHELEDLGFGEEDLASLLERGMADGKLTIRAQTDGVVLEMGVQRHQWTQAFEPLMVLGDPSRLELQIRIPPADASRVTLGDRIDFVPVGRPEIAGRARVLTPIPRVDPVTRTVAVRAEILSTPEPLFPGVFIEGMLTHGEAQSALSVPESAVIRIGGSDYVFVDLPEAGAFEARPVELGRFNGTRYEIVRGLSAGEQVAVQGVFFLKSALLQGEAEE
jgi:cobalt-zinc-cadmium efflux system membrane fusion protein